MQRSSRSFRIAALCTLFFGQAAAAADAPGRPNVVLILADDMGFGDLGYHGNPKIRTPHLDKLARQSVRMKNFHVSPVCSPTRSSLVTGRYNYRTGVVDTFLGRSLMHPDEVTVAKLLRALGYRTGIFGKWHLGDNYPMRAMDQGFEESLVLKGGGIGQPSDPPGGSSYFDPVLQHNGKQVRTKGYVSDVLTDAALDFIAKNKAGPFFVYLPFNAPHSPLEVPESYEAPYQKMNLRPDQFPKVGQPFQGKTNQETIAKVYGMITNIDDNVGKLLAKLDELGLSEHTIVIFLTDNGPAFARYNGGLRGLKGTVFEGGTRVPFFVRWPAKLPGDRDVDRIAAHIDVTPTLLEACGAKAPAEVKMDGVSLLSLWKGDQAAWPDRTLYFQWHRGDVPQLYRACAARSQRYRLVQPQGVAEKKGAKTLELKPPEWKFHLFDIENDPYETTDIADKNPELVQEMKAGYLKWFKEMALSRGFQPSRIYLGAKQENPTVLTKQDWRGPSAGWGPKDKGYWEVKIVEDANYDITVYLAREARGHTVHFKWKDKIMAKRQDGEDLKVTFANVALPEGNGRIETWVEAGPAIWFVEVRKRE
jgi:arylsulfatase A-like enzyme